MLDSFLVAVLPVLLLVFLFSFLGCSLIFTFAPAEPDLTKLTAHVRFDPSLGGDYTGFEWPPPDAFDILMRIQGTTIDGDDLDDEVPNSGGPTELVGNGLIGYVIETTLRPGDYQISCEVFAPAQGENAIVTSDTCNMAIAAADRGVTFWADPASDRFHPC